MVEWFQERYISRDEHQGIVTYYRKLVAQLHSTIRDLQAQVQTLTDDALLSEEMVDLQPLPPEPRLRREGNVIHFDFRRNADHGGAP